jgi:hypothetical protein
MDAQLFSSFDKCIDIDGRSKRVSTCFSEEPPPPVSDSNLDSLQIMVSPFILPKDCWILETLLGLPLLLASRIS